GPFSKGFARSTITRFNRARLTVPLLCWRHRGRFESEGSHQVERRSAQVQVVQRCPQVDHVSLLAALRVEATEHVVLEVHTEGPPTSIRSVDRTGTAPLQPTAAQPLCQPQMPQQPLHRQLLLDVGEVNEASLAKRLLACYLVGTGRGDHFLSRH